jgi:tetratricopeptide (TPR) repeat protein
MPYPSILSFLRSSLLAALLTSSLILTTPGCSILRGRGGIQDLGGDLNDTVAFDLANARRSSLGDSYKAESRSLHDFLVGQISLGDEDYASALKHFERSGLADKDETGVLSATLADLYVKAGRLAEAEKCANKAIKEGPRDPYVRILYAGVLEALGRPSEAIPVYQGLIDEYPAILESYLMLSRLQIDLRRYDTALEVLKKFVSNLPDEPIGHINLARLYEFLGKLPEAEKEYRWVFENDPNLQEGSMELLRVLVQRNQTKKVKQVCERIIAKNPDNELARKVLSTVMIGENRLDDALKHLTALKSLESDPSETRFKVALIQIDKENFKEAERELNLVLATNPGHSEARYYLASLMAGSGRVDEALGQLALIRRQSELFSKAKTFAAVTANKSGRPAVAVELLGEAIEADPKNINLILYCANLLDALGRHKEMERRLRQALELKPDDAKLRIDIAIRLYKNGDTDGAFEEGERAIALDPNLANGLNFLAYGYATHGRELERAEQLSLRSLEIMPDEPSFLDTLGFIYFRLKKLDLAEEALAKAVKKSRSDPVIVEHYATVLILLGKIESAKKALALFESLELTSEQKEDKETVAALERVRAMLKQIKETGDVKGILRGT